MGVPFLYKQLLQQATDILIPIDLTTSNEYSTRLSKPFITDHLYFDMNSLLYPFFESFAIKGDSEESIRKKVDELAAQMDRIIHFVRPTKSIYFAFGK